MMGTTSLSWASGFLLAVVGAADRRSTMLHPPSLKGETLDEGSLEGEAPPTGPRLK
jgi:hypothetical protein